MAQSEQIEEIRQTIEKIRREIESGDTELLEKIAELAKKRPLTQQEELTPRERSDRLLGKVDL